MSSDIHAYNQVNLYITRMREKGVVWQLDGQKLKCECAFALSEDEIAFIKENKIQIMNHIKAEGEVYYPCSYFQEKLIVAQLLGKNDYSMPILVEIGGKENNTRKIGQLIGYLLEVHPILRSAIKFIGGKPYHYLVDKNIAFNTILKRQSIETLASSDKLSDQISKILDEERVIFSQKVPLVRVRAFGYNCKQYLLININHVIADDFSLKIVEASILEFVSVLNDDKGQVKPFVNSKFFTYCLEERGKILHESESKKTNSWKKALEGSTDYFNSIDNGSEPGFFGEVVVDNIEASVVKNLCQELSVTPYVYYCCALLFTLSRLRRNVTLSMIKSLRKKANEDSVGPYITELFYRLTSDSGDGFSSFVKNIKQDIINLVGIDSPQDHYINQATHALGLNMARLCNAEILFKYNQKSSVDSLFVTKPRYGLALSVYHSESNVVSKLTYESSKYSPDEANNIASLLLACLSCDHEEVKLLKGNIAARHEKGHSHHSGSDIVDQWERTVALQRRKVAIVDHCESYTFNELDAMSDSLLYKLKVENALCSQEIVALLIRNKLLQLVAIIACLKGNISYIPVSVDNIDTLDSISQKVDLAAVISDSSVKMNAKVIYIDIKCCREYRSISHPHADSHKSDIAYAIFTSASTSEAKLTAVSRGNLASFSQARSNYLANLGYCNRGVWLWSVDYAFDMSLQGIAALISGFTLNISVENNASYKAIEDLLAKNKITIYDMTPSQFTNLVKASISLKVDCIMLGGEPISIGALGYIRNERQWQYVLNAYGPTEATVNSSIGVLNEAYCQNIGRPLSSYEYYVLDSKLSKLKDDQEGELYIGGESISHGYIDDPRKTAEVFLPNPFQGRVGERMYKTSDIVQMNKNGVYIFSGRKGSRVKVSGLWHDLEFVRKELLDCHYVVNAGVFTDESEGRLIIVAAVVLALHIDINACSVMHMNSLLSGKVHPSRYLVVESLPITSRGKLDQAELKASYTNHSLQYQLLSDVVKLESNEWNEVYQLLASVWKECFSYHGKLNENMTFFDIGGRSMDVLRLQHLILEKSGVELPVHLLYKNAMFKDQVSLIEGFQSRTSEAECQKQLEDDDLMI